MSMIQIENINKNLQGKLSIKSEADLPRNIAGDILCEIVERAMDISEKSTVGDILPLEDDSTTDKVEEIKEKCDEKTKKGLGDQLEGKAELITRPTASKRHPPVEKKYRLTDLVRNSKQILSKYILQESKTDLAAEKEEKLISVTELDIQTPGTSKIDPSKIPLPSNDSEEIVSLPDDSSLDEINLPACENKSKIEEKKKKTMTFPMVASPQGKVSFFQRCRTLRMQTGDQKKKKKWNLGAKFAQFLKKGQRKEKKAAIDEETEKETDEVEAKE